MNWLEFITPQKIVVVVVTLIAFITDIKYGRIYNKLTFPAIVLGWLLAAVTGGIEELRYSFFATFLALVLYLPFAAFGFIGMGDVKLLAAIGAICGPTFMFSVFLYTGFFGFIHAIIIQWLNFGRDGFMMLITSLKTGIFLKKSIQNENQSDVKYKFFLGIDLFLGTIIACIHSYKW